jgi:TatD DNase family protein
MQSIAYPIGKALYLNITNRCMNDCSFCIRKKAPLFNQEHALWLEHEPTAEEVIKAIGDPTRYEQIVFCGYGEPLLRLDVVKEIARKLKTKFDSRKPRLPAGRSKFDIRIDTNGQANLFWGRNILPELEGLVDSLTISLNAENEKIYDKLCQSTFGKAAYPAILEFIKEAKKYIPQVEVSVVDQPGIDKAACKKIAAKLGVSFRIRPYYEKKYVR